MASRYYKPCPELDAVNELFRRYWDSREYEKPAWRGFCLWPGRAILWRSAR